MARVEPLLKLFDDQIERWILAVNNSTALAILDGSLSMYPTGAALDYVWTEGRQALPADRGVRVTNVFGLGVHEVTLTFNAGGLSDSDTLAFEVITPAEAVAEIAARLDASRIGNQIRRPLQATLAAGASAFERGQLSLGSTMLERFREKVQGRRGLMDPALAETLITAADRLLAALASAAQ